jgi:hypothetical protein
VVAPLKSMFSRLKTLAAEQAAAFTAEYEATAASAAAVGDSSSEQVEQPVASDAPSSSGPTSNDAHAIDTTRCADGDPASTSAGSAAATSSGWMSRVNGGWMNSSLNKVKAFIPDSVETFRTEHEVTAAQVSAVQAGSARPPWEALTDEELPFATEIKAACAELAASSVKNRERREQVFMTAPPVAANFDFSLSIMMPTALACLAADSNLEQLRFGLVPRKIKEEVRTCPAASPSHRLTTMTLGGTRYFGAIIFIRWSSLRPRAAARKRGTKILTPHLCRSWMVRKLGLTTPQGVQARRTLTRCGHVQRRTNSCGLKRYLRRWNVSLILNTTTCRRRWPQIRSLRLWKRMLLQLLLRLVQQCQPD